MFQGVQCVIQGADHIKANKICQDAAKICEQDHFAVASVSDGHGGAKYIRSDIGSKYAVEAAVETVCAYMEDYERFTDAIRKNSDYILNQMECHFITKWNNMIEIHRDAHELTDAEREILDKVKEKENREADWHSWYGCTVLCAVMAEGYSYGMLVGDGTLAAVYEDGMVSIPIEDPYSVANMTSSVCDKQCKDKFQHYYEEKQPLSMTVSSDGLCKSFGSDESLKDYHLRLSYMMNTEQFVSSLEKNLQNFTQKGSGDDISVATVFPPEVINEKKTMLFQLIEEKKKLEQERKAAEEKRLAEVKRQMEEARQREERRRQEEEQRRQEEERRRREEERRRREREKSRRELERRHREELRILEERNRIQQEKERETLRKMQEDQRRRERELQERERRVARQQADIERRMRDGLAAVKQMTLEGAAYVAEKIGTGAHNMEEILNQKMDEQTDLLIEDVNDMMETEETEE